MTMLLREVLCAAPQRERLLHSKNLNTLLYVLDGGRLAGEDVVAHQPRRDL